ncbi:MAG: hypothetical protein EU548_07750, partial [Promethearchaeota archaeon]
DVLGSHVNQAGAKKTLKSSHLDITHFEQIPRDKLKEIERRANEIVKQGIDLYLDFIPRTEAEKKYGMAIYQGGAVPGKNIRIVEVPSVDVEACGGTHLNNTAETGKIKIIKSQKIQDGVVRLKFTAGKATERIKEKDKENLNELVALMNISSDKIVGRVKELLKKWKNVNKSLATGNFNESDLKLTSNEIFKGDILTEISYFLNIKKDQVPSKIEKLYLEWNEAKIKIKKIQRLFSNENINNLIKDAYEFNKFRLIIESFENLEQNDLKNFGVKILKDKNDLILIFLNKTQNGISIMGMVGERPSEKLEFNMGNFISKCVSQFGGKGGGRKDFGQGFISRNDLKINDIVNYIEKQLFKS